MRIQVSGPVDADTAWRRYDELDLWPTWSPQLRRVEPAGARLAAGLAGRVHGPLGVVAGFEVLDVDRERRTWSWRVRRWPVEVRLEHGVEAEGDGCRTWLDLHGPLPVVVAYAPVARLALRRLVALD